MLSFVAGKTLILRIATNYQLSIAAISHTEDFYKRSSCQSLGIDTSFYHVQSGVSLSHLTSNIQ